ncbi:MAG: 3-carboxy-cis,cis-muconate cycloisomerase [Acidobacteria bacterium]|jgi:3-carboxy-cis,cis-muconate cycloisomerase|nr:3-carboxy-cis,cis-muconate cycloisomerase [Acidobacteriota bacterium]MDP7470933.1 3-carboxy-cis,cis-muconate cycloisomerase [Vicinamibacterales bacterium]HJN44002.1 3-carboxy-cis,cis-muconate cycloisomerase [Vicinamibacterales bacterium]|tara:strand:- start:812 stop:2230 length:1419 start_codon:yes stop_codon:yes gene_type:complete
MSDLTPDARLHDRLLGVPQVAAQFAATSQLQVMLDVEAALAEAEASLGVVPVECVAPIRAAARADYYDRAALVAETAHAGNPVVPLVRHLTARVAATDPDAARYVHWGATSQDIMDTGLVLQLRAAVPHILDQMERAASAAARLARRYADTPLAGRTWLQQATPTTFGLKAAGWLDTIDRTRRRLRGGLDETLVLQFGGAAGTLASLGSKGPAVADALAERLELRTADTPWHAHRDRLAHLACALGVATGAAGKIARDLALLAQTEVGEVAEAPAEGRGGSSTMPQKRNPVGASVALAAAARAPGLVATVLGAMVQEHERGLGGWQAEWDALPDLVLVTAGGIRALADSLDTLVVDPERMRANVEASGGMLLAEAVAMALATPLGKAEAHACVEAACRRAADERRRLADVLADDPVVTRHLDRAAIEQCLAPEHYLGAARVFIDRVLGRRAGIEGRGDSFTPSRDGNDDDEG